MPIRFILLTVFFSFLVMGEDVTAGPPAQRKPFPPQKASPQVATNMTKATIRAEQAYIFTQPDFDAEVITILGPGKTVYMISKGKAGPFYQIVLSPGKVGYILDSDVAIEESPQAKKAKVEAAAEAHEKRVEKAKLSRPMTSARYLGPALQMTNYSEDTMASLRSESLIFYGAKWTQPSGFLDLLDINAVYHSGPPEYYVTATNNTTDGWILLGDMILQMTQNQSKDTISFFGIGPMIRYSHIAAILTENGNKVAYSLDDMVLGAALNLGLATRLGGFAVRFEGKYYWEKQKYWALGLAFQFDL